MEVTQREAKSILTPQRSGFLAAGPYPFTHALSAYTGCAFGQTTCGMYCYAQFLPNWSFHRTNVAWGEAIEAKTNAAQLLEKTLHSMRAETRRGLRIFMSSTTDPYQPQEQKYQLTRQCLEVFARYPDLDLLVVQTRSPLAARDLPLLSQIPYAWLSVSIETDNQAYLKSLRGGPLLEKRWELVRQASERGINVQITVSPCLSYRREETFGQKLLSSGARRVVVDTMTEGDGAQGERSARTPFALAEPAWAETTHAHRLYGYLQAHSASVEVSWSNAGFCGIPFRAGEERG